MRTVIDALRKENDELRAELASSISREDDLAKRSIAIKLEYSKISAELAALKKGIGK